MNHDSFAVLLSVPGSCWPSWEKFICSNIDFRDTPPDRCLSDVRTLSLSLWRKCTYGYWPWNLPVPSIVRTPTLWTPWQSGLVLSQPRRRNVRVLSILMAISPILAAKIWIWLRNVPFEGSSYKVFSIFAISSSKKANLIGKAEIHFFGVEYIKYLLHSKPKRTMGPHS